MNVGERAPTEVDMFEVEMEIPNTEYNYKTRTNRKL